MQGDAEGKQQDPTVSRHRGVDSTRPRPSATSMARARRRRSQLPTWCSVDEGLHAC